MKKIDNNLAAKIRTQLVEEGTFSKTGIEEIDDFLEFIRKDIAYINKYNRRTGQILSLAQIAYEFVVSTLSKSKKTPKTYRNAQLNALVSLEKEIYLPITCRSQNKTIKLVMTPEDFVARMELMGMKKGTVLMNPALKDAYDLISYICNNPYHEGDLHIAHIIYWAQNYVHIIFQVVGLVGQEKFLNEATDDFYEELVKINRSVNITRKDKINRTTNILNFKPTGQK